MRKKLANAVRQYIRDWAYFIGNCMADGFADRSVDIFDEEQLEELKAQNPKKEHGPN